MKTKTDELKQVPADIRAHVSAHIDLYLREPEKAHYWDSTVVGLSGVLATLLLCTRGRKSGEKRYVALQYFKPEDCYIVVASKGGVAENPSWYLNLTANPQCEIQVGAFRAAATARVLESAERARLWNVITKEQPAYLEYQAGISRTIPLVALDLS